MSYAAKPKSPSKSPARSYRSKLKRARFRILRWIRILTLSFFASTVAAALLFRFIPPPLTPLMAIRCFEQALDGRPFALDKDWTRLAEISPRLAEAVVASEDQRFFDHGGFDFDAISSAFTVNGRGKRKLGASTITQQTAKNLFLWPDRSWLRKGLEAYFTLLLELTWSKRRILEVYLNVIETGDGTYGAEAAARRYFQVSSARLTGPQAALIAAALPNPRAWSPANPTGYLRRRQTWILQQMDHLGPLPRGLSRGGPSLGPRPRPPVPKPDGAPLSIPNGAPNGAPKGGAADSPSMPTPPPIPAPAGETPGGETPGGETPGGETPGAPLPPLPDSPEPSEPPGEATEPESATHPSLLQLSPPSSPSSAPPRNPVSADSQSQ